MAMLHIGQASTLWFFSRHRDTMKEFEIPILTHFLDWKNGYPQLATQKRWMLPFTAAASAFSMIAGVHHIVVLANFEAYTTDLRKGINRFRWWEYAISSSVMISLIALLFGVQDIMTLIGIVSVNISMNLFGLLFEVMNSNLKEAGKDVVDWQSYIYATFNAVAFLSIVLVSVFG